MLNVFNQKTSRHRFNYLNRDPRGSRRSTCTARISQQGYDYNAMIRATPDGANAFDPRFNMDDLFSPGAQGHFLVKWLF